MKSMISALALLAAIAPASSADLNLGSSKDTPIFSSVSPNWSGYYLGVQVSYDWDQSQSFSLHSLGGPLTNLKTGVRPEGVAGGLSAGVNYQTSSNLVLGLETDISIANIDDNSSTGTRRTAVGTNSTIDYYGTMRGRIGIPMGNLLFYGTGGFAYGGVSTRSTAAATNLSSDETKYGATVGGGVEWKMSPGWSADLKYLHVDLGSESLSGISHNTIVSTNSQSNAFDSVMFGLKYKLGSDLVHPVN